MTISTKEMGDIASKFDISNEEAERIAATVDSESEFVTVWEDESWWKDDSKFALPRQYPTIARFFEANAKDWATMNQDAAIIEALDSLEENRSYELRGMYTNSGNPEALEQSDA